MRSTLSDALGLHARLDRLASGHAKGLQRLRRSLTEPKRVLDLFSALFARPIDARSELLGLATGETVAHLNHLRSQGGVSVSMDAAGVCWFRLNDARTSAR